MMGSQSGFVCELLDDVKSDTNKVLASQAITYMGQACMGDDLDESCVEFPKEASGRQVRHVWYCKCT